MRSDPGVPSIRSAKQRSSHIIASPFIANPLTGRRRLARPRAAEPHRRGRGRQEPEDQADHRPISARPADAHPLTHPERAERGQSRQPTRNLSVFSGTEASGRRTAKPSPSQSPRPPPAAPRARPPLPPSAPRQPRTLPTASTIVKASTNSTRDARNAATMDGPACAVPRSRSSPFPGYLSSRDRAIKTEYGKREVCALPHPSRLH